MAPATAPKTPAKRDVPSSASHQPIPTTDKRPRLADTAAAVQPQVPVSKPTLPTADDEHTVDAESFLQRVVAYVSNLMCF